MKFVFLLAFIIISVNAIAQQPPGAVGEAGAEKMAPATIMVPSVPQAPAMAPEFESKINSDELSDLLRAQTTAIRVLSGKIESLEERISNIERAGH